MKYAFAAAVSLLCAIHVSATDGRVHARVVTFGVATQMEATYIISKLPKGSSFSTATLTVPMRDGRAMTSYLVTIIVDDNAPDSCPIEFALTSPQRNLPKSSPPR